jgi:hypothetical protein
MIYKSLYLDPATHDIVVENGSIRLTNDGEITLQKIKTRLLFFVGDNFLNPDDGVDYLQYVFARSVTDESIRNLFIKELQGIPEIIEIMELEIIRNRETEKVSISFKVKDMNGNIVEGAA